MGQAWYTRACKELMVPMSNTETPLYHGPDRFELENHAVPEELITDNIRLMARHRSIRSFRSDPLPGGCIEVLAAAAQSASTSSNLQTYSMVAVQSSEKKKLLAE